MPTVSRVVCPHIDSGIKAVSREEASKQGTVVQALSRPAYFWHRVHGALYDVPEASFSQVVRCFPEVSALMVFLLGLGKLTVLFWTQFSYHKSQELVHSAAAMSEWSLDFHMTPECSRLGKGTIQHP